MQHSFLDKYAGIDSIIHSRDPRAKWIAFTAACLIILSEPRGEITAFSFYALIILIFILLTRIPIIYIMKRCLAASPFIILAAVMLPISIWITGAERIEVDRAVLKGLSLLLKAFCTIVLLTILTSTESYQRLLKAMRLLKFPHLLNIISALMYRYLFIISDELHKTNLARKSRTPGRLQMSRFRVYSHQAALIFTRSWHRSHRVYDAMCSRGFTGEFPLMYDMDYTNKDTIFLILTLAIFLSIRLFI